MGFLPIEVKTLRTLSGVVLRKPRELVRLFGWIAASCGFFHILPNHLIQAGTTFCREYPHLLDKPLIH